MSGGVETSTGRRAPYGARGLKQDNTPVIKHDEGPRPVRGAWVETAWAIAALAWIMGRAPYGARGLKREILIRPCCGATAAPRTGRVG